MKTTRASKRVKTSQWVRLQAPGLEEGATSRGEAVLSNVSSEGVCLEGVTWEPGTARPDASGLIDLHIPWSDWTALDLKVQPVRVRLRGDRVEIGAVIVNKPATYEAVLETLDQAAATAT